MNFVRIWRGDRLNNKLREINESDFCRKYIWEIQTDNPSLAVKISNCTPRSILQVKRHGWKWPVIIILEFSQPPHPEFLKVLRQWMGEARGQTVVRAVRWLIHNYLYKGKDTCRSIFISPLVSARSKVFSRIRSSSSDISTSSYSYIRLFSKAMSVPVPEPCSFEAMSVPVPEPCSSKAMAVSVPEPCSSEAMAVPAPEPCRSEDMAPVPYGSTCPPWQYLSPMAVPVSYGSTCPLWQYLSPMAVPVPYDSTCPL